MEALGAHSAFSTHYCSQEQGSEEEEEEDEGASLEGLRESLQVTANTEQQRRRGWSLFSSSVLRFSFISLILRSCPQTRQRRRATGNWRKRRRTFCPCWETMGWQRVKHFIWLYPMCSQQWLRRFCFHSIFHTVTWTVSTELTICNKSFIVGCSAAMTAPNICYSGALILIFADGLFFFFGLSKQNSREFKAHF